MHTSGNNPRILLITYSISGGAGKACLRLFEALKDAKCDVKILKLKSGDVSDKDIISMYSTYKSIFLKKVMSKIYNKINDLKFNTYNTKYKLPVSIHRIEEHPLIKWADFINIHWVSDFIDYKRFFKSVTKPIIWTLHDMLPFSGGYHYELDNLVKDDELEKTIINFKYKYLKKSKLKIVAPSKWLVSVSSKSKVFGNFQHRHIFNPLSSNIFKPHGKKFSRQVLNLPANGKILVFSADNISSERKGMNLLIDALSLLNFPDLTLVSIGRKKIKIKPKIPYIHLGTLKDDYTISLLYSAADLSVVPSKEDNSPNTIIESFACGCPVVAFNVGGISELVHSEKLGLLVDNFEKTNLANSIKNALKIKYCPDFISSFIKSKFSYKVISKNYLDMFKSFKNDEK